MPKCPECRKPIDHLDAMVTERNLYVYSNGEFDNKESIEFDIDYWKCPQCLSQLDIEPTEDKANDFLG